MNCVREKSILRAWSGMLQRPAAERRHTLAQDVSPGQHGNCNGSRRDGTSKPLKTYLLLNPLRTLAMISANKFMILKVSSADLAEIQAGFLITKMVFKGRAS